MAYRRYYKLILLPLFLASLSGCQAGPENGSANADRYDSPNITVASLEADCCMLFEDMYFARGEEKDHVFRFKEGRITEHVTCPKARFDAGKFDDAEGEPFLEVVQNIGIPSFRGLEKDHSVTYLCKDGIERSLSLSLNGKSEWTVSAINEKEIVYSLRNQVDAGSTYRPTLERCKSIKMGMYLTDALFILGRPSVFSEPNGSICAWGMPAGGSFHVSGSVENEGSPFFDPKIFERDEYFGTYNAGTASKPDMHPCYWSVERVSFNEHGIEDYPNVEYIN